MTRMIRVQFILVLLSALLAAVVLCRYRIVPGIDLGGGAELRYKVLFEPGFRGDRQEVAGTAADVLRRRLESRLLQEPKINRAGDDEIVVQLPGVDAEGLSDCKRLVGKMGELRLHAAAPQEHQERFARDREVPAGFKVVRFPDGTPILVQEAPVIEGRHIVRAEPEQNPDRTGSRWVTAFELDADGARRFDEAAATLYHQRPPGRIVILLDGVVKSAPAVQSPSFHGRGRISSSRE